MLHIRLPPNKNLALFCARKLSICASFVAFGHAVKVMDFLINKKIN